MRHGARTPQSTYPNDPYINETFFPYGWGQLTNVRTYPLILKIHFFLINQKFREIKNYSYSSMWVLMYYVPMQLVLHLAFIIRISETIQRKIESLVF